MAAIGNRKEPMGISLFKLPHLPKNKTPLGAMAVSKSITEAALALPIPKLIMVMLSAVAVGIGLPFP